MNSDSNTEKKSIDYLLELFKSGEQEKILFLVEAKDIDITPENKDLIAGAYTITGNKDSEEAKLKSGPESDNLFREANKKFDKAFNLNPDSHEILNYWGNSLLRQANTKSGEEADKIFDESYQKFDRALKIKPDYYEALSNWGNKFSRIAIIKSGAESESFFNKAHEKYKKALEIKPDHPHILYNFACSLSEQAKRKNDSEADKYFTMANKMFARALELNPDYHQSLNGWGVSLFEQAQGKLGKERDELLELSQENLIKAETLKIGSGSYNLACINAIMGKENLCKKWLEKSYITGYLPSVDQIMTEPDLSTMINKPWFKEFIENLKG